jgi:hypothetical protein
LVHSVVRIDSGCRNKAIARLRLFGPVAVGVLCRVRRGLCSVR